MALRQSYPQHEPSSQNIWSCQASKWDDASTFLQPVEPTKLRTYRPQPDLPIRPSEEGLIDMSISEMDDTMNDLSIADIPEINRNFTPIQIKFKLWCDKKLRLIPSAELCRQSPDSGFQGGDSSVLHSSDSSPDQKYGKMRRKSRRGRNKTKKNRRNIESVNTGLLNWGKHLKNDESRPSMHGRAELHLPVVLGRQLNMAQVQS